MSNKAVTQKIEEYQKTILELESQIKEVNTKITEGKIKSQLIIDGAYKSARDELADYKPVSMNLTLEVPEKINVSKSIIEKTLEEMLKIN